MYSIYTSFSFITLSLYVLCSTLFINLFLSLLFALKGDPRQAFLRAALSTAIVLLGCGMLLGWRSSVQSHWWVEVVLSELRCLFETCVSLCNFLYYYFLNMFFSLMAFRVSALTSIALAKAASYGHVALPLRQGRIATACTDTVRPGRMTYCKNNGFMILEDCAVTLTNFDRSQLLHCRYCHPYRQVVPREIQDIRIARDVRLEDQIERVLLSGNNRPVQVSADVFTLNSRMARPERST